MDIELSQDQALELAFKTLTSSGATEENAMPLAKGIIQAEIDGIKSHGFHSVSYTHLTLPTILRV